MPDEELHQPNDKLFSDTFRVPDNAAAFLQAKLPPAVAAAIHWPGLRHQPGSFVDSHFRHSHTDLLFSAPLAGRDGLIYLLFEHQSSPDSALPVRLLRYMTRIWEDLLKKQSAQPQYRLPVILPVVLSQNAEVWHIATSLGALLDAPEELAADLRPFIPDFEYRHLQLAEMAFDAIPGTASGIYVLRAMKAERLGRLLDPPMWDLKIIKATHEDLLLMVLRFMYEKEIDKTAFSRKVEEISDPQIRATAMTLAQQFRQEGLQEGQHKGLQQAVLEELAIRFGVVPEGLKEAINACQDTAKLRELFRAAVRCETLEAFAEAL